MSKRLPRQTPQTPEAPLPQEATEAATTDAPSTETLPATDAPSPNPESDAAAEPSADASAETATAVAETPAENLDAQPEAEAPAESAPSTPTPATDPVLLRRSLEALLFITDRPLSAGELARLVGMRDQDRIVGAVEEIRRDLEAAGLGYRLIAVAEGWQMATRSEYAPYVRKLFADRATMRLSTAAQETLSIVAYRQPLTRAEIEQIRGVEVIAALETLLEKRLLKVVGRRETVGRPLMYGTTPEFLRHFGLRSLEDLPPLDNFAPAEDLPASAVPADAAAAPAPEVPAAEFVTADGEAVRASAGAEQPAGEPAAEPEPEAGSGEDAEGNEDSSVWPK